MTAAPGVDEHVVRARALGYVVSLAAPGYVDPASGRRSPDVYRVEGNGAATMVRDDDGDAWAALLDPAACARRAEALAQREGRATCRPAPAELGGPLPGAVRGDPSRDYPQMSSWIDLEPYGYVEEERFVTGEAASIATPGLGDGVVLSRGHPYRTRVLVRRPADPTRFNGTVVVEWLNVSAFANVDNLWLEAAPALMRRGYGYVGASVQRAGIDAPSTGLRDWSPVRYASLDVTGGGAVFDDSLCYDIFSQVGLALRDAGGTPALAGLVPARVLAFGASQSHRRLAAYHNAVHASAAAYDGFLLSIGRGACELRADLETKALKVNSETDVVSAGYLRQPDTPGLRTWEVAGASHTSHRLSVSRAVPEGRGDVPPIPYHLCELPPLSRIPSHHVLAAALWSLERWSAGGPEPPAAEPIALTPGGDAARDEHGNARGGVRLSQHEVATATNTGVNAGPGFLSLCGSHVPFDDATLRALYPDRTAYVAAVRQVDEANLAAGFILEDAAEANAAEAERFAFGRP